MSNVLIFDPATGNGKEYLLSVNTPDYAGRADALINPNATLLKTVPAEYVKVSGGSAAEMTAAEKAAVDAAKPVPVVVPDPVDLQKQINELKARVDKLEGI